VEIIDKERTANWLSIRGLLGSKGKLSLSGLKQIGYYPIPADSGRKTIISRTVASFFDTEDESLLWIDEYGIWKSCEDWILFDGFRQFLGEGSPLYEKPGHIFSRKDLDSVCSLLAMTLYFCWGAVIVKADKSLVIRISHDEILDIYITEETVFPKDIIERIESVMDKEEQTKGTNTMGGRC
jgi:hypothetical protein